MERHEIDDELSTSGAQDLLNSTSAAHLAYIGTDGNPRVIPVGFWWTGDQVVVSTATTSPKVAALSAHPDVALSIGAGDTPDQARALSIRGRATVEIVDGLVPEYLAAARNTDAEVAAEFEQNCRDMYDQMARIAITPSWVRYYDFGSGRMPRFLKELAERNQSEGRSALGSAWVRATGQARSAGPRRPRTRATAFIGLSASHRLASTAAWAAKRGNWHDVLLDATRPARRCRRQPPTIPDHLGSMRLRKLVAG